MSVTTSTANDAGRSSASTSVSNAPSAPPSEMRMDRGSSTGSTGIGVPGIAGTGSGVSGAQTKGNGMNDVLPPAPTAEGAQPPPTQQIQPSQQPSGASDGGFAQAPPVHNKGITEQQQYGAGYPGQPMGPPMGAPMGGPMGGGAYMGGYPGGGREVTVVHHQQPRFWKHGGHGGGHHGGMRPPVNNSAHFCLFCLTCGLWTPCWIAACCGICCEQPCQC